MVPYQQLTLDSRMQCDVELLLQGAYHPVDGFMTHQEYETVLHSMRYRGRLWSLPIVLPVDKDKAMTFDYGETIQLTDATNLPIAFLTLTDIFPANLSLELDVLFRDINHPYYEYLLSCAKGDATKLYYLGGTIQPTKNQILHFDNQDIRMTPTQVKDAIAKRGWNYVIAFQTRNPMHRCHYALTEYAYKDMIKQVKEQSPSVSDSEFGLLLHPAVGISQQKDIAAKTRIECYRSIVPHYSHGQCLLSLLSLNMRMAGPREAIHHAIVRKNFGATHFIVGRGHAEPSCKQRNGEPFYSPYEAQELFQKHEKELGITMISSKALVYVQEWDTYIPCDQVPSNVTTRQLSGTQLRTMLEKGETIPSWFTFPEIATILQRKNNISTQQGGLCVYFIGLSGSGKSTLSNWVKEWIEETYQRPVTLLDGDVVRQHLSKGLSFSKEDRSTNVQRIGYVASEIVKHGGLVLCANIAPYDKDRQLNRQKIEKYGTYLEVFVDTSLSECERRDVKGLYHLARQGTIPSFTGISDPFEMPTKPDLIIKNDSNIKENIETIQHVVETYLKK